jgi:glutamyl-tRNA synthetase
MIGGMPSSDKIEKLGRFAPSPTGDLHLGNLRTALVARSHVGSGGRFIVRMEDLDRVTSSRQIAEGQLSDLKAVGVISDVPVVFQSERFDLYRDFVKVLAERDLVYECFCSRKEIQQAVRAPHGGQIRYPGTCRDMSQSDRIRRRRDRPAAIRLKSSVNETGPEIFDDIVLLRNDGVPAYNLAVVVDDELQGVTEVVRGDDLVHVTPTQIHLQELLGFRKLDYRHVPLLCGPDGEKLSKRHGDITLADCRRLGYTAEQVRIALLRSFDVGSNGWGPSSSLGEWLESLL